MLGNKPPCDFDLKINKIRIEKKDLEADETTTGTKTKNDQEKISLVNPKIKSEEKENQLEVKEKEKGKIDIEYINKKKIINNIEYNNKNVNDIINDKKRISNERKNNENIFQGNTNSEINRNYLKNQINFNIINNNYLYYLQYKFFQLNQSFNNINRYIKEFERIKFIGLHALGNPQNINHYLYNIIINNFTNGNFNKNNLNPFNPFNSRINVNFNYYGLPNPLITNYIQNQNIMMKNLSNISNINNSSKPKKYTITLKSETNIPNVKKVSKIEVITSYHNKKDNSKINQEKNANSQERKEKLIKNTINIEDIIQGKETRTVVRLNPIPPNYSSFDISKLLDIYLKIEASKNNRIYKAIYVPLCKVIGKNLGYCFVMMTHPKYVIDFYKVFSGKVLAKKKCNKPSNVIWADIQGDKFLKLNEDDPIRKPLIFKDVIKD